jgi:hypothetical protein
MIGKLAKALLQDAMLSQESGWTLSDTFGGIEFYVSPHCVQKSLVNGMGKLHLPFPPAAIEKAFLNPELSRARKPFQNVAYCSVVEDLDAFTTVERQVDLPQNRTAIPRDRCILKARRRMQDGTILVMFRSVKHPKCKQRKSHARVEHKRCGWILQPVKAQVKGDRRGTFHKTETNAVYVSIMLVRDLPPALTSWGSQQVRSAVDSTRHLIHQCLEPQLEGNINPFSPANILSSTASLLNVEDDGEETPHTATTATNGNSNHLLPLLRIGVDASSIPLPVSLVGRRKASLERNIRGAGTTTPATCRGGGGGGGGGVLHPRRRRRRRRAQSFDGTLHSLTSTRTRSASSGSGSFDDAAFHPPPPPTRPRSLSSGDVARMESRRATVTARRGGEKGKSTGAAAAVELGFVDEAVLRLTGAVTASATAAASPTSARWETGSASSSVASYATNESRTTTTPQPHTTTPHVRNNPEERLVEKLLADRAKKMLNDSRRLGWQLLESRDGIAWYVPVVQGMVMPGSPGSNSKSNSKSNLSSDSNSTPSTAADAGTSFLPHFLPSLPSTSFHFLPLPSFLPSFLPSLHFTSLPSFLHSFISFISFTSFLPSLPPFLPSLPSFLPSFL